MNEINRKYVARITFPQGINFEHDKRLWVISNTSCRSEIILKSNDFRKIKSRSLEIGNKYSAAYIDIFNVDTDKSVFFTYANDLIEFKDLDSEEFNQAAWQYYSRYPKVIIKKGKLGYVKEYVDWIDLDE